MILRTSNDALHRIDAHQLTPVYCNGVSGTNHLRSVTLRLALHVTNRPHILTKFEAFRPSFALVDDDKD